MNVHDISREEVQKIMNTWGRHIRIEDDMSKSTGKTEDAKQRAGAAKLRGYKVVHGDCDYERSANMTDEWVANAPGFLTRLSDGEEVGRPYLVVETQNFDEEGNPVMEDGAEVWTSKLYPAMVKSDFKKITYPDLLVEEELTRDFVAEGLYSVRFHDEVEELMKDSLEGWIKVRDSGAGTIEELSKWIPSENTRKFLVSEYNRLSNLVANYKQLTATEKSLKLAISRYEGLDDASSVPIGRRTQVFDSPDAKEAADNVAKADGERRRAEKETLYSEISTLRERISRKKKELGIVRHVDKKHKWPLLEEQTEALQRYLMGGPFDSPFQKDTIGELLILPNEASRFRDFKDLVSMDPNYYETHKNSNLTLQNILYAPETPEEEDAIRGFDIDMIVEDNPFDLDKNPELREIRYKGASLIVMPITSRAAVAERARGTLTSLLNANYVGKNKLFVFPNQYPIYMPAVKKFWMDVGNRALFGDALAQESKNDVYFGDEKVRKFDELFEEADTTPIPIHNFELLWSLIDSVEYIVESTGKLPESITDEDIEAMSFERNYHEYDQVIATQNVQVGSGENAKVEARAITVRAPGKKITIYDHDNFLNSNIVTLDVVDKLDQEVSKVLRNRVISK